MTTLEEAAMAILEIDPADVARVSDDDLCKLLFQAHLTLPRLNLHLAYARLHRIDAYAQWKRTDAADEEKALEAELVYVTKQCDELRLEAQIEKFQLYADAITEFRPELAEAVHQAQVQCAPAIMAKYVQELAIE